jgi:hypothetical protein
MWLGSQMQKPSFGTPGLVSVVLQMPWLKHVAAGRQYLHYTKSK